MWVAPRDVSEIVDCDRAAIEVSCKSMHLKLLFENIVGGVRHGLCGVEVIRAEPANLIKQQSYGGNRRCDKEGTSLWIFNGANDGQQFVSVDVQQAGRPSDQRIDLVAIEPAKASAEHVRNRDGHDKERDEAVPPTERAP